MRQLIKPLRMSRREPKPSTMLLCIRLNSRLNDLLRKQCPIWTFYGLKWLKLTHGVISFELPSRPLKLTSRFVKLNLPELS